MSKKLVAVFIVVALVIIALGIWLGLWISGLMGGGSANPNAASPYSAVYLTTGDVYFGKLGWFPSPHMTDVWFVQRNQAANGQTQLGVAPFTSLFWMPVDEINFDEKQIVFTARLKNSSQLVQAIENPQSAVPQAAAGGQQGMSIPSGTAQPAATSTGK
jgi:hypothetical protein